MTEDQLKELLRQRAAHFQAPEDYGRQILRAVHQRQRTDWVKVPLWRVVWDRLSTLFGEHSLSTPAYVSALAGITVVGLVSIVAVGQVSKSNSSNPLASPLASSPLSEPNERWNAGPVSGSNATFASSLTLPADAPNAGTLSAKTSPNSSSLTRPEKPAIETQPVRFEKR